jgi:hypothetical protein
LQIDARECRQVGQAMLQLLISARQTAEGAVIAPSRELEEIARLTGLSDELFSGVLA